MSYIRRWFLNFKILPPSPPKNKPHMISTLVSLLNLINNCIMNFIFIEKCSDLYLFYSGQFVYNGNKMFQFIFHFLSFVDLCVCIHIYVYVCTVSPWKIMIFLVIKHPVFSSRSHLLHISTFKLLLNHRIWQALLEDIWG